MRHLLAILLTSLLAAAPAAAQPFPQNSQGLVYNAFTPTGWATLNASTATGNVALGSAGAANTPFVAWVQNTGANAANVVLGKDNTVVATLTSGTYVAAGQCVALNALGAAYLAAITGSSTTTLNIMTGTGVPSACTGGGSAASSSNATIVSPIGPTTAAAASVAMVFGTGATLPAFAATPTVTISGGTLTDRSGTITLGGTAQTIANANGSRRGYTIQNNSTGPLWFTTLGTAVTSQPSFQLAAGALYETPPTMAATGAISIIGATTSQAFTAREW